MSCQALKTYGENLNGYYYFKDISMKMLQSMIPTIWYSGQSKTMEIAKISVVDRDHKGERYYTDHRGFLGQEKYSVWYYNDGYMPFHNLFKHTECTTQRVNSNVNHYLLMTVNGHCVMCQFKFTGCNKCTLWWEMLTMRKAMHV